MTSHADEVNAIIEEESDREMVANDNEGATASQKTDGIFNSIKDEQSSRFDRLSKLVAILPQVFSVKNNRKAGFKTVEVRNGWDAEKGAINWKEGFRKEYEVMATFKKRCDDGMDYNIWIEFDTHSVELNEEMSNLIIDEKDLIADIAARGHRIFLI